MKIRVVIRWPSKDILPEVEEFDTAEAALNRCRALRKQGMRIAAIDVLDKGHTTFISQYRLRQLRQQEAKARQRTQTTLAGILLSILASALPNGFGDFGICGGQGLLRAARASRCEARHRCP